MRISALLTALLMLLSLGGLTAAHCLVADTQDALVLTPRQRFGDPSAAEGLEVELLNLAEFDRLCWDTRIAPGQGSKTEFFYDPSPETLADLPAPLRQFRSHYGVDLAFDADQVIYDSGASQPRDPAWLYRMADRMAVPTEQGQTVTQVFRLVDFMEAYELSVRIDWPDSSERPVLLTEQRPTAPAAAFLYDLRTAFAFPVPEDQQIAVTLAREDHGLHLTAQAADDRGCTVRTATCQAGGWFYFLPEARAADGTLWDYSGTPHGYGLYRLPDSGPLSLEALEFVAPLDPAQHFCDLETTADGSTVLLVTRHGGAAWLHQLDPATGQEISAAPLWETVQGDDEIFQATQYGEVLLAARNQREFCLLERASGLWQPRFSIRLPEIYVNLPDYYAVPDTLAWNGETAALAMDNFTGCGFSLLVYDRTGLLSWTDYESSLDTGLSPTITTPDFSGIRASWS